MRIYGISDFDRAWPRQSASKRRSDMRRWITAIARFIIGCTLMILGSTIAATAEIPKEELRGYLELGSREVAMGQPLVVTVTLKNEGTMSAITNYARPQVFRGSASVEFVITSSGSSVSLVDAMAVSPRMEVPEFAPDFIKQVGVDQVPAIKPGEQVSAKRTVALAQQVGDKLTWLPPGAYTLQAKIRIQSRPQEFVTTPETFTIKPLALQDQGVLAVLTPDMALILQGYHNTILSEAPAKADELRKKFPSAVHRQYLEYQLLWWQAKGKAYAPAAEAYLQEFPKSPYADDVLLNLGQREKDSKEYDKATGHLEILLREHPASPLKQEAENLLTEIKEVKQRGAAREAAKTATGGNPSPTSTPGAAGPSASPTGT
jgi:hypothetical protein